MVNKTAVKFLFRPRASPSLNVNQLLHLMPAGFSEEGSSRRVREETAYRQFVKYTREVYGKYSLPDTFANANVRHYLQMKYSK